LLNRGGFLHEPAIWQNALHPIISADLLTFSIVHSQFFLVRQREIFPNLLICKTMENAEWRVENDFYQPGRLTTTPPPSMAEAKSAANCF
jgi:hypothetical protein